MAGRFASFPMDERHLMAERVSDWDVFLDSLGSAAEAKTFRRQSGTGRPLGSNAFVARLERTTGRRLRPRKVGRKPKAK